MPSDKPYTGLEIEAKIQQHFTNAPHGTCYCVLCLADQLEMSSAQGYLDIAKAVRRIGTFQADYYEAFQGKCPKHTGQSGAGTFWMLRRR